MSGEDALPDLLAPRVAAWAAEQGSTLVVGISGPQGCGKSTTAARTARRLSARGLRTAILGLDDLYLTRAERERLADEAHPLLRTRGPPGTHDVALGLELLDALGRDGEVRLPRFDKSCDDRAAGAAAFQGPADVVLLEGWCVGVRPQPGAALAAPVNPLERQEDADGRWRDWTAAALARDYARLWARCDRLAVLTAPDWPTVVRWRTQAEAANRGMNAAALARFMQHYERLTRWAAEDLPPRADLHVALTADRRPALRATGGSRGTPSRPCGLAGA